MKNNLREKKFVDAEVQGALTKRLTLHWALYIGITAILVVGLKWLNNPFTPFNDHLTEIWVTHGSVLVVLLSLAPIFIFDTVKLSNRFVGPVLRIRSSARQIGDGKIPKRIKLRNDDFWKDLAAEFNRIIDRVEILTEKESVANAATIQESMEDEAVFETVGGASH